MPYRNFVFEKDQPFHIISRAVDERKIFVEESDCYRFIFQMYAANLGKPNFNLHRANVINVAKSLLNGYEISDDLITSEHDPLVYILDFCLNVTHYHFYLLPAYKDSVPLFIKKLNGGFAKYFNLKHNRKGPLFISRYKSIPIDTDFQSDAVSRYVSVTNPLDMHQPGWRENGLVDIEKALRFLEDYKFSSFPDKIGRRQSKILAAKEILYKYGIENYNNFVKEFLKQKISLPKNLPV